MLEPVVDFLAQIGRSYQFKRRCVSDHVVDEICGRHKLISENREIPFARHFFLRFVKRAGNHSVSFGGGHLYQDFAGMLFLFSVQSEVIGKICARGEIFRITEFLA